jgi:hypothetical protein
VPIDPVEPRIAMFFCMLMFSEKGKQIRMAMQPTQTHGRTNQERSVTRPVLEEEMNSLFDYGGVF